MNYQDIINKARELLTRCMTYIKVVRGLPHFGKYASLSIVLIIFFTIVTFPYEILIKKKLYDSEGKSFKSITLKKLDFSIMGRSSAENVELLLNNGDEVYLKSILLNLSVNPYRLFISKRYVADFQFDDFRYTAQKTEFMLNLNGNIDITIDKLKGIPSAGDLKFIIEEAKLKLKEMSIPGPMGPLALKLDAINIQNGLAEADIVNGVVKIRNFRLSGTDLNCSITGTVELADRSDNSRLNLNISIDPESAALEQYKELILSVSNNGPLLLSVQGTLGRPEIKISGAAKNQ